MLRENSTADAHWALWVDCMREPAPTFFSLHHTSKRRTEATVGRREQMGKFWETYKHLGDYPEQHLHARHKLMSLNWQLRQWTRQTAAARRTSGVGSAQSAEAGKKPRGTQTDAAAWWEWYWDPQASPSSRPDKEMKTHVTMPSAMGVDAMERASRTLPHLCIAIASVGGTQAT